LAGELWHLPVEHDQIGPARQRGLHGSGTVFDRPHLETFSAKDQNNERPEGFVVFGDQNPGHIASSASSRGTFLPN
jgi:hypothetical protein